MPESKKSNFSKIQIKEFMSETQYYQVIDKIEHGLDAGITVRNERGMEFNISAKIVSEGIYSAHDFTEVVKVSRTELVELFGQTGNTIFTANFNKLPKAADINEAIESANKGKILPIAELKKLIKKAYEGEERTLVGYLIKTETAFGRSMVIDLEADKGNNPDYDGRIRLIDHRNFNWFISKMVKYTAK